MKGEIKNKLATILNPVHLDYFYITLRKLYMEMCDRNFRIHGEAIPGSVIDAILSLLLTVEPIIDPSVILEAQNPSDQEIKDRWDLESAIVVFRSGPKGYIFLYLSAFQWLCKFAPSEVKKLIYKSYEKAGGTGIEFHHAFEKIAKDKLIQFVETDKRETYIKK